MAAGSPPLPKRRHRVLRGRGTAGAMGTLEMRSATKRLMGEKQE